MKNLTINNEAINIPAKEIALLGPDLVLNDCIVEIKCASKDLSITGLTMEGGRFNAKKELCNFQIKNSCFRNVEFLGSYSGVDFGEDGAFSSCDFSKASLDNCRFISADLTDIVLPKAGHIVLNRDTIADLKEESKRCHPKVGMFIQVISENQPTEVTGIIVNENKLAKRLKIEVSDVEILRKFTSA